MLLFLIFGFLYLATVAFLCLAVSTMLYSIFFANHPPAVIFASSKKGRNTIKEKSNQSNGKVKLRAYGV